MAWLLPSVRSRDLGKIKAPTSWLIVKHSSSSAQPLARLISIQGPLFTSHATSHYSTGQRGRQDGRPLVWPYSIRDYLSVCIHLRSVFHVIAFDILASSQFQKLNRGHLNTQTVKGSASPLSCPWSVHNEGTAVVHWPETVSLHSGYYNKAHY